MAETNNKPVDTIGFKDVLVSDVHDSGVNFTVAEVEFIRRLIKDAIQNGVV